MEREERGSKAPSKAIKGNRSVLTSDKLFAALPGHKDVCLFAVVCEALTKFVPAEVTVVSLRLFSLTATTSYSFAGMKPVTPLTSSLVVCA